MRDFETRFMWMDEFDDASCCVPESMVSRGSGWHFPAKDGNPAFESFRCAVCGRLWFRDDGSTRFYSHRRTWVAARDMGWVAEARMVESEYAAV